jgi:hypothetical protein
MIRLLAAWFALSCLTGLLWARFYPKGHIR